MRRNGFGRVYLSVVLLLSLVAGVGLWGKEASGASKELIKIATTSPGVPWHVLGARVAAELNKRLPDISVSAATGGSTANIIDVSKGTVQLGWTVHESAIEAYQGQGRFKKPIRGFSVITPFAQTPWQVIVHKNSGIQSIKDLPKFRIAIGKPTWGTTDLTLKVLRSLGITPETFKENRGVLIYTGYDAWQVQMQDGTIDGVIYWGGLPSSLTISLINEPGVRFIAPTGKEIKKVLSSPELSVLFPATIPKNFYPPIKEDLDTFTYASIAIANDKEVDQKLAYEVAKIICEPPPEVKEVYKDGLSLTLDLAKKWFSINKVLPIHPGAQKYFREKGILK